MAAHNVCIIVAGASRARFFRVEPADSPRSRVKLVERSSLANPDAGGRDENTTGRVRTEAITNREAGPVHPIGAQRARHELELERRFSREIARQAAHMTGRWKSGTVVLIAEPRLLGLTREVLREALKPGIELKELAKDYAPLTAGEIHDRLVLNRLVPVPRGDHA